MIFPGEDAVIGAPRATALFSAAASVSEANIWTSVNGWSAARVYTAVEKEYEAAKKDAVVADLGPIARYAVRGPDAGAFLTRVTTAPAGRLEPGESARGLILNDRGEVIDLAEVSRLTPGLFLLTTPRAHARRLQLAARGLNAVAEDIAGEVAVIGVFGPKAYEALSAAGMKTPGEAVAVSAMVRGVETAARPVQFSALPGFELIFPREEALTVWERLVRRSGAGAIGLDAFEILRLESGAPRPGVDFIAADRAHDGEARFPAELGLAHLAPLDRGWFNGRRALRQRRAPSERRLVTLLIDDERSAPGASVFAGGKAVGRVTSWVWSPVIKRVVAFADLAGAEGAKSYEVAAPAPSDRRVPARLHETAESALESAFRDVETRATDSRR